MAPGITPNQGASQSAVSVKDYKAMGDGVTDDTSAVTSAITAAVASGSEVFFPPGTYMVGPGTLSYILPIRSGLRIRGAGIGKSVIKVKPNAGNYDVMFGPQYSVVSDVHFSDMTIDQNSGSNPIQSLADLSAHPRMIIATGGGNNFTINDVEVRDINAFNTLYISTRTTSITNCRFTGIGGGSVYHDYSALYLTASAIVTGNLFQSSGLNAAGAVTAIETHSGDQTISGNTIDGMLVGMNVSGIGRTESNNILVSDNTIAHAYYGIQIWSRKYGSHQSGYGISGLTIGNNIIRITQNEWNTNAIDGKPVLGNPSGIFVDPNANLPIKAMTISNNSVEYDLENNPSAPIISAGFGIGYWDATGGNSAEEVKITNNTIINAPGPGVRISVAGSNVEISSNKIINPGSTLNPRLPNSYRAGIVITSPPVGVRLLNNSITDNLQTTRMKYGIYVLAPKAAQPELTANTVSASGVDTSAFARPISVTTTPK